MSAPHWIEWISAHFSQGGVSWLLREMGNLATAAYEEHMAEGIHARARWIAEETPERDFRFFWEPGQFEEMLAEARTLEPEDLEARDLDLLDGRVLGISGAPPKAPFPWLSDPFSKGKALPRGNLGEEWNRRAVLVPGRLQVATLLAFLDRIQNRPELGHQALDLIADFHRRNPYPERLHWAYPVEVARRLLNLIWVRALLGRERVQARMGSEFLEMVYLHQRYLHVFREFQIDGKGDSRSFVIAAVELLAGLAFPHFPETGEWRDVAAGNVEQELFDQTFEDGVGIQQSTEAELSNLELCLMVVRMARTWHYPLEPRFLQRVESMCEYLAARCTSPQSMVLSGELEGGSPLGLPLHAPTWGHSVLASAALLYRRPEWARLAGSPDARAILLAADRESLDEYQEWIGATQIERHLPREAFPHGGRFFFRSFRYPPLVLGFDAGNMGVGPMCEGAHADALSVTCEIGGRPVLIDPGSYLGADKASMHEYLRSTGAHNTVRVNWEDSAVPGPERGWRTLTPIYDRSYATSGGGRLIMAAASQLGYCKQEGQIVHRRMITRDSPDSYHLAIEDRIEAPEGTELEYEILFHFHPDVAAIQMQRDLYQVRSGDFMLSLRFSSDNSFEVGATQGHEGPLLGWVCQDGHTLKKIWVLRVHGRDQAPIVMRTAIFPG